MSDVIVIQTSDTDITVQETAGGAGGSVVDATSTIKGVIKLTGDLGGTAALPTVPGLANKADKTTTVNGHSLSADVTISKGDVGLGSVDNTSDTSKPVSTATQTALDGKAALVHTHTESDITGLTADLASKQATLVSGTNIKTVGGTSLLGSGDIPLGGGGGATDAITSGTIEARITSAASAFGAGVMTQDTADASAVIGYTFPAGFAQYGNAGADGSGLYDKIVDFTGTDYQITTPAGGTMRVNGIDVTAGGGGGLIFVTGAELADTNLVNITGLDGDTDGVYELHVETYQAYGIQMMLRFNDDQTGANYRYIYRQWELPASNSMNSPAPTGVGSGNGGIYFPASGNVQKWRLKFNARSGQVRMYWIDFISYTDGLYLESIDIQGIYKETATNITNINLGVGGDPYANLSYRLYKYQQS